MKRILTALAGCALVCLAQAPAGEAQTETVLYSFCSVDHPECTDGEYPTAALINVHGDLYGTTTVGGPHGYGEVFSLDPATNLEKIVYPFCSQKNGGKLCTDGESPQAGVIDVDGMLYGTTLYGGHSASLSGTVFSVNLKTGDETVLYSFSGKHYKGARYPDAGVIDLNGVLYGTTDSGGDRHEYGTVFSLDLKKDTEMVLDRFSARKKGGIFPEAGLIDIDGTLYGTTSEGGKYNGGTVFSIDPTTGAETVLHSFRGYPSDGAEPFAGLINVKGRLYGSTEYGGAYGVGTVFSVDPTSDAENLLYSFQGYPSDGGEPVAGVINVKGMLYGTTQYGGSEDCSSYGEVVGCGTVFSLDPNTGVETMLYSFCAQQFCADGDYPMAALLNVNGTLYGTTKYGGAYGGGTVFSIVP